ncbi:hypothetical protein PoB_004706200 [Plakobranchus ocellatus]|uniref:Uncharacterized protein n=1 Tax=Plakobranchus ocellatus TaxID=259542 RepID=A0AAV4BMJ5_9GAST|nr:hypothetical protein PoB_004706200 [Plakobranchus ocellatus]
MLVPVCKLQSKSCSGRSRILPYLEEGKARFESESSSYRALVLTNAPPMAHKFVEMSGRGCKPHSHQHPEILKKKDIFIRWRRRHSRSGAPDI